MHHDHEGEHCTASTTGRCSGVASCSWPAPAPPSPKPERREHSLSLCARSSTSILTLRALCTALPRDSEWGRPRPSHDAASAGFHCGWYAIRPHDVGRAHDALLRPDEPSVPLREVHVAHSCAVLRGTRTACVAHATALGMTLIPSDTMNVAVIHKLMLPRRSCRPFATASVARQRTRNFGRRVL